MRSLVSTMYQLGFDLQAVPSTFWLNMSAAGAGRLSKGTGLGSSAVTRNLRGGGGDERGVPTRRTPGSPDP